MMFYRSTALLTFLALGLNNVVLAQAPSPQSFLHTFQQEYSDVIEIHSDGQARLRGDLSDERLRDFTESIHRQFRLGDAAQEYRKYLNTYLRLAVDQIHQALEVERMQRSLDFIASSRDGGIFKQIAGGIQRAEANIGEFEARIEQARSDDQTRERILLEVIAGRDVRSSDDSAIREFVRRRGLGPYPKGLSVFGVYRGASSEFSTADAILSVATSLAASQSMADRMQAAQLLEQTLLSPSITEQVSRFDLKDVQIIQKRVSDEQVREVVNQALASSESEIDRLVKQWNRDRSTKITGVFLRGQLKQKEKEFARQAYKSAITQELRKEAFRKIKWSEWNTARRTSEALEFSVSPEILERSAGIYNDFYGITGGLLNPSDELNERVRQMILMAAALYLPYGAGAAMGESAAAAGASLIARQGLLLRIGTWATGAALGGVLGTSLSTAAMSLWEGENAWRDFRRQLFWGTLLNFGLKSAGTFSKTFVPKPLYSTTDTALGGLTIATVNSMEAAFHHDRPVPRNALEAYAQGLLSFLCIKAGKQVYGAAVGGAHDTARWIGKQAESVRNPVVGWGAVTDANGFTMRVPVRRSSNSPTANFSESTKQPGARDAAKPTGISRSEYRLGYLLPKTIDLPLPAVMLNRIREFFANPENISREFQSHLKNGGEGIAFDSGHFTDGDPSGEREQAHFVRKALQTILPKAQFGYVEPSSNRKVVELAIFDTYELKDFPPDPTEHDEFNLDMIMLKPANGTAASLSYDGMRNLFGIPSGARVISVYSKHKSKVGGDEAFEQEVLGSIAKNGSADVIISSVRGTFYDSQPGHKGFPDPKDVGGIFDRYLLTDLPIGGVKTALTRAQAAGKKLLLFNNTSERMSAVHAAADLEIVIGAINMFEGLAVGTPTMIVHEGQLATEHAFDGLREAALATGGAVVVNELPKFAPPEKQNWLSRFRKQKPPEPEPLHPFYELVEKWLHHPRVPEDRRPYLVANDGKDPLQRFLERLTEVIELQLSKNESNSKLPTNSKLSVLFPQMSELPLPDETKRQITTYVSDRRRGTKGFREQLRAGGKDITFYGVNQSEAGWYFEGEHVQGAFVQKVLEVLFPEAQFQREIRPSKVTTKNAVGIEIFDEWEHETNRNIFGTWDESGHKRKRNVDMQIIKPANGTAAAFSHDDLKSSLGIPSQKVVSVYQNLSYMERAEHDDEPMGYEWFYDAFGSAHPSEKTFLIKLAKESDAGLIILSFPVADRSLRTKNEVVTEDESGIPSPVRLWDTFEMYALSELPLGSIPIVVERAHAQGMKVLIHNDTFGRLPAIHASADLAIVIGAMNIFESLSSGTPTIVVDQNNSYGTGLHDVSEIAKATGGALFTTAFPSSGVLNSWMRHPRVTQDQRPYLIRVGEESAFESFMKRLVEVIGAQLKP